MTCSHCEESVNAAISAMPGVTDVLVDLPQKLVAIAHDGTVSIDAIKRELEEIGYEVS